MLWKFRLRFEPSGLPPLKNHHFLATCEILRLGWELWEKHVFIIFIFTPFPCQFRLPNTWFLKRTSVNLMPRKSKIGGSKFNLLILYLVMWVPASPCRFHSLCGICVPGSWGPSFFGPLWEWWLYQHQNQFFDFLRITFMRLKNYGDNQGKFGAMLLGFLIVF